MISYFLLFILTIVYCQKCLNHDFQEVSWWVHFKVPGNSNNTGYGYFDSTMKTAKIIYYPSQPDLPGNPLYNTLSQIQTSKLQVLAWNDQLPNGSTTTAKAHSKGLLIIQPSARLGLYIDHSLPKYPDFPGGIINITVNPSQNVYGQHLACFALPLTVLDTMAEKWMIIKPNIYFSSITNTSNTTKIYKLSLNQYNTSTAKFDYYNFVDNSVLFRGVYKNGNINSSMFEDGINKYLSAPLAVESWGRPLQASWCGSPYPVVNVLTIRLTNEVSWKQTNDHSKWAITTDSSTNVCFGDLNRMQSQFKRGGSFLCIESSTLHKAVSAIIETKQSCIGEEEQMEQNI